MSDLEKTIKGHQCHSEPKQGEEEYFCEFCPYDECTCGLDVPDDALKLLKAQQPRVMTLEEAKNFDFCFCESGNVFVCRIVFDSIDRVIIQQFGKPDIYIDPNEYGIAFRCWTSRPTDEQMEATPWGK